MNPIADGIRMAKLFADKNSVDRNLSKRQLGAVSAGEVQLEALKHKLEGAGVSVEYRLGAKGGVLVCDGTVVISKSNENEFDIEGSWCRALVTARKVVYECFTFL